MYGILEPQPNYKGTKYHFRYLLFMSLVHMFTLIPPPPPHTPFTFIKGVEVNSAEEIQAQPLHSLGQLLTGNREISIQGLLLSIQSPHFGENCLGVILFSVEAIIPTKKKISDTGQVIFDDGVSDIEERLGQGGKEGKYMKTGGQEKGIHFYLCGIELLASQRREIGFDLHLYCHGENGRSGCLEVVRN